MQHILVLSSLSKVNIAARHLNKTFNIRIRPGPVSEASLTFGHQIPVCFLGYILRTPQDVPHVIAWFWLKGLDSVLLQGSAIVHAQTGMSVSIIIRKSYWNPTSPDAVISVWMHTNGLSYWLSCWTMYCSIWMGECGSILYIYLYIYDLWLPDTTRGQ